MKTETEFEKLVREAIEIYVSEKKAVADEIALACMALEVSWELQSKATEGDVLEFEHKKFDMQIQLYIDIPLWQLRVDDVQIECKKFAKLARMISLVEQNWVRFK